MAKRIHDPDGPRRYRSLLTLLLAISISCILAYLCLSPLLQSPFASGSSSASQAVASTDRGWAVHQSEGDPSSQSCCRGMEHTELWSDAVNWGSDFLVDTTEACCQACKANAKCNSWVYCADEGQCGSFYRQCWLKRQKDPLNPEIHDTSSSNPWTSGLQFDKDVGIVGLTIDSGTMKGQVIHMKLLPDCSPQSVLHILELLRLTHCQGCRFYRAEGRGQMWDSNGNHISKKGAGPPYALVQGTLEAQHVPFKRMPAECTPAVGRGMVGWVDGGPDFFISLADHEEWPRRHTVFATVVEADMRVVETLAELPTIAASWEKVAVQVLDSPVHVKFERPSRLGKA